MIDMDVWFVMLLLALLFHTGDIVSTWLLFYFKRKHGWHIKELNKTFSWWFGHEKRWVSNMGFVAGLEFKFVMTLCMYFLIVHVSDYFGLLLALWYGTASVATLLNMNTLAVQIKEHNKRVGDLHRFKDDCVENLRTIGLVDTPRSGDPPVFVGKSTTGPKRYLWWYGFKGRL